MMPRFPIGARRVALAVAAAATLVGCGEDKVDIHGVTPPGSRAGGALFDSYVALGNSLTAGWQSGGISDSTQRQSYAYLLAKQAGARFVYPSLAMPGCPIPATNFGDVVGSACAFRRVFANAAPLNNVGVPTAFAFDSSLAFPYDPSRPGRAVTAPANPLQTIILGGETQIQRAADAKPTFVSLWIGNNDVLAPASVGVLTPVAGASPGLLPSILYTNALNFVIDSLTKAAPTIKGGILIGVVSTVNAPRFFRASNLCNGTVTPAPGLSLCVPSTLGQQVSQITGKSVTIFGNCAAGGPGANRLISTVMFEQIKQGAYPPIVSCDPATTPPYAFFAGSGLTQAQYTAAQFGNLFVIDATEEGAITAAVTAINGFLQTKATSLGWAFYDPNNATNGLPALKAANVIPALPNFADPKNPFGTGISVDGVHPRRPVSALVTNALIDAINAKYQTSIPKITDVTSPVAN